MSPAAGVDFSRTTTSRRPFIRTLIQTLLIFLVAALVFVGGLASLLALNSSQPVTPVSHQPWTAPRDDLPDPTALPRVPPSPVDAAVRLDVPRTDECVVRIVGQGPAPAGAVVAILDGRSGTHLALHKLDTTTLPCEVRFQGVPAGKHWAVLARIPDELRFAYLSRARLQQPKTAAVRVATLRGQQHDLVVQLEKADPKAIYHCVPVVLRRPDDPRWRHREPGRDAASPALLITDQDGKMCLRGLGAGRYLLHLEAFDRKGAGPEWLPITLDMTRTVRIIGASR